MLKSIRGYIEIKDNDVIEKLSEVLSFYTDCEVIEEEEDFIVIEDFTYETIETLLEHKLISEEDANETPELDTIKFYIKE